MRRKLTTEEKTTKIEVLEPSLLHEARVEALAQFAKTGKDYVVVKTGHYVDLLTPFEIALRSHATEHGFQIVAEKL